MKSKHLILVAAVTLTATLAAPIRLAAQSDHPANGHHHYKLVDIGTFGGPNSSSGFGGPFTKTLNSRGTVTGEADTTIADPYCMVDCWINHVFQWRNGAQTDLGALPGANNSIASWINSRGWVSGFSENGVVDPLTGFPETNAVLWKNGGIINLGTLGGNVSGANAINDQGQVVGGALNAIPDPFSAFFPATLCGDDTCIFESFPFFFFGAATQMHAVLWQGGATLDLGTLGGPDSVALFINEHGQIAGLSYLNSNPNPNTGVPTVDPFFVGEDGKMVDIGGLGGTASDLTGFNNRGQVVGAMTLAGDLTFHPFSWHRGILTDLGTFGGACGRAIAVNSTGRVVGWACDSQDVPDVFAFVWRDGVLINLGTVNGDPCSVSDGVNTRGQVVGESSPSCFVPNAPEEAFLWENDAIVDLNTLIPPNSGMELAGAAEINDHGEISGAGVLPNGDLHAFLLIPCDENHAGVDGCDYSMVDPKATEGDSTRVTKIRPIGTTNNKPPTGLRDRMRARSARHFPGFGVQPQE